MKSPTDTTTLEALLRRWAEPERCILTGYEPYQGYSVRVKGAMQMADLLHAGDYVVQGATQEAIERRGWSWSIVHIGTDEAMVFIPGASLRDRLESLGKCNDADTPAAALLSAYVQALEAQA